MVNPSHLDSIDILLSTYNGEKFLSDQLESIVGQDLKNWHLLIRDDGSSDSTVDILGEYRDRYPKNITILNSKEGNLGAVRSFFRLMENSSAPYIAFCDQDDVWEIDKLSSQLAAINYAEHKSGKDIPLLVHSDLKVVNENFELLSNSFWKYQKLDPNKMIILQRLLTQNCVTGCSMLVNRTLLDLALEVKNPENIIMHDWWFALIASAKGKVVSMREQTVFYRQHAGNDIGAKKWGVEQFLKFNENNISQLRLRLIATKWQAKELLETGILGGKEAEVVQKYVEVFDMTWIKKRLVLTRFGFFKYGFLRNLIMFLVI